ncbi:MAG: DNA topoisomerase I [Cuniculiplasma divulgatum]|nr:MAG: DNA topoisomerase I [Cuniculiplasma divulgatum]
MTGGNDRNIIITEKADAARRIAYILSNGESKQKRSKGLNYIEYQDDGGTNIVIPLSGHIVELDFPPTMKDWKSVSLEKLIDAEITRNVTNKNAFNSLVSLSDRAWRIIIATDFDREGELIGSEALDIIRTNVLDRIKLDPEIRRARFSALTPEEIRKAFSDLTDLDNNLAQSAAAREEIDLYWGAVLTRFFSITSGRMGKNFISIGRVQTPTLVLVVRRELEIRDFQKKPYWIINILLNRKKDFTATYSDGPIWEKEKAEKIFAEIDGKDATVLEYSTREERIPRPVPFNTTEFLREASRIGVQPGKAMKIAESLYTRGYISYPRTDNTVYQKSIHFKSVLTKLLDTEFREDVQKVLDQESIRPSRGRIEATDHPPIYPVSAAKKGALSGDFARIYELVLRRFLATLYREGKREITDAAFDVNGHRFSSRGLKVLDSGWLELYPYRKVQESFVPPLAPGDTVKGKKWNIDEEETKPPARYDFASLIKKMEELNLGTKSTRHDIIDKLQSRGFIEGNPVRPTYLGMGVIESLLTVKSDITEPDMTAELEKDMDRIANNEIGKDQVVAVSREMLHHVLAQFREKDAIIRDTIQKALRMGREVGTCPEHGTPVLLVRNREYSRIKCSHEGCRIDFPAPLMGTPEILEEKCPVCGLPEIRIIRRGQSPEIRCIDPHCKFNQEKNTYGKCPEDGGDLVLRQSRFGKRFLGCSNYPNCKKTYPVPQMGNLKATGEVCPHCGAPLIISFRGKRAWKFCPNMSCEYNRKKGKVSKAAEQDS